MQDFIFQRFQDFIKYTIGFSKTLLFVNYCIDGNFWKKIENLATMQRHSEIKFQRAGVWAQKQCSTFISCSKTYTEHHNLNPQSKYTGHIINTITAIEVNIYKNKV